MMPEMDGFDLAERIREQYTIQQTKLIILSSASRGDDAQRCVKIGISRYLTKPVVQSELLETVLQVMGMKPAATRLNEDSMPACPPMRVLVAEDGIANQHVAVGMLQAGGHQSVVVSDGRETVARWQSEPFDLILMDMHMPVMDGIEATQQIRAAELATGGHIPIIALTAAAMKEDADACREAGMDAYLPKPIHPRMLQEMLAKYAPQHSTLATPGSERETGTSFQRPPGRSGSSERLSDKLTNSELFTSDERIDLRAAASRVPGGLHGVRRLAEVFLPECDMLMAKLRAEIPAGDPAVIHRLAHTLKGSANLFCANKVHDAASVIEQSAQEKSTFTEDQLLVLEQEVKLMMRVLRNFLAITAD